MKYKLFIVITFFIIGFTFNVHSQVEVDSTIVLTDTTQINSTVVSDTVQVDSTRMGRKKKKKREKKGRSSKENEEKPEKLVRLTWTQKSLPEKDTLLQEWSEYDKKYYKEKYAYSKMEKKSISKREKNFFDRMLVKKAKKKPAKYRRKLIKSKNKRLKKTLKFEEPKKMSDEQWLATSQPDRLKYIQKKNRFESQKETIRKNKVIKKYDRKEDKINKKYALSVEEKIILNKGRSMHLRGTDQLIYKRAKKKQITFTEKLLEIRKDRQFEIQNKTKQKQIKELIKKNNDRYKVKSNERNKQEKRAIKNKKKRDKERNKRRKR